MTQGWQRSLFAWVTPNNFYKSCSLPNEEALKQLYRLERDFLEVKPYKPHGQITMGYTNLNYSASVVELGIGQCADVIAENEERALRQSEYENPNPDISSYLSTFNTYLHLRASPFSYHELCSECAKVFSFDEYNPQPETQVVTIALRINTDVRLDTLEESLRFFNATLKKVLQLFENLNKKQNIPDFTPEFIKEITSHLSMPFHFRETAKKRNEELTNAPTPHINPEKENCDELVNLIMNHKAGKFPLAKVQKELINGADPYQGGSKHSLLLLVCNSQSFFPEDLEKLLLLFIAYGSSPLKLTGAGFFYTCPFYAAKYQQKSGILDIFTAAISKFDKPISIRRITKNTIRSEDNEIITTFEFEDKTSVTSYFKKTENLTYDECEGLFKLFSQFFEITKPDGQRLPSYMTDEYINLLKHIFFHEDVAGKDKFIDLVYCNNKLIGFHLLELVKLQNEEKCTYLHSAYGLILPEFRNGSEMMKLLAYRLAYSLNKLMPDSENIVGVILFSNHFNSFRTFLQRTDEENCFAFFPYYQPPHLVKKVYAFIKHAYGDNVQLVHDNLTCYITEKDPLKISGSFPNKSTKDIDERVFNEVVQGRNAQPSEGPRVTPVMFLVEDNSFDKFKNRFARSGLEFEKHVTLFTALLPQCIKKLAGKNSDKQLKLKLSQCDYLFFMNTNVPSSKEKKANRNTPLFRSKL